jgi:CHASE2 domain-containing sensor protein
MTKTNAAMLLWAPRMVGIAMALFLSLFALDAFDGRPFLTALPGFLIHVIPAGVVLAAVALAWRLPLAGAVAFTGLALAYAIAVRWRLGWIAVIGGPLVVVAILFLLSWRYRDDPNNSAIA